MGLKGLIACLFLASTFTCCHKEHHWSYDGETGPENWAELEKDSECDGSQQSPINIITIDAIPTEKELKPSDFHYTSYTRIHDVMNNGHTIQYNFEMGDFVYYKGRNYNLTQFHFHSPSEHTINGLRYPLEMHMVHTDGKGGYVVVSIMAIEGKVSEPFAFYESFLPIGFGESKPVNAVFDFNKNVEQSLDYYHYVGSLTTPPCTEGVNWFILKEPMVVSADQVELLEELMPMNNYRGKQPLGERHVHVCS